MLLTTPEQQNDERLASIQIVIPRHADNNILLYARLTVCCTEINLILESSQKLT